MLINQEKEEVILEADESSKSDAVRMEVDFKQIERALAEYKVYDAWQYIESLGETLGYMTLSRELVEGIYENRKNKLKEVQDEIISTAVQNGSSSITSDSLNATNLKICGYTIDDTVFLKKTAIEFFHYARVSMDILFQIVNAALLGDKAFSVNDKRLLMKVTQKIKEHSNFSRVYDLLEANKNDSEFVYLQSFDNYIKHIKTVLITIKNSFMIGNSDEFEIREFHFNNRHFEACDAIEKIKSIHQYVFNTVDDVLCEMLAQIPNCLDNSHRIQKIKFKMQVKNDENGGTLDFASFFIEVNELSDLPNEIKVFPLLIKPNDEIYSFDFKFEKIFIKKLQLSDENDDSIIGYAVLKNGVDTNEFYRVYEVFQGSKADYYSYLATFKQKYNQLAFNFYAMEGEIISYSDKDIVN